MKRLLLVASIVFFYHGTANSQLASNSKFYILDRSHSEMTFSIKWMTKGKVVGTFDNVTGAIYYDPQKPKEVSASLTIDIKSLNTGNALRDNTLRHQWFDTAAHRFAYFESLPISQQDKPGKIRGRFTLKGITNIITLTIDKTDPPAMDFENNPYVIITGRTTISRKSFNVGVATSRYETSQNNSVAISDSVMIEFNLYGRQTSAKNALARLGGPDNRPFQLYSLTKDATKDNILQKVDNFYNDPKAKNDISVWLVANYFLTANDLERASVLLDKTTVLFPESIAAYDSMMQYYYHTGQKEQAKKYLDKILQKDPHLPIGLEYQKRLSKM
jgi:polyisoprenoid-binding protein YceI